MNLIHKYIALFQPAVLAVFVSILLAGVLGWLAWARPRLVSARRDLLKLAQALGRVERGGDVQSAVSPVLSECTWLQAPWRTTRRRLITMRDRQVLLGSVNDLWQTDALMHRRFNVALFEAIPNIAVGVGLFFTFLFLTLALTDATSALAGTESRVTNPLNATKDLLSSAGGKFLSSLAGLLVSLSWTFLSRHAMAQLDRAAALVVDSIESHWPAMGSEMAVVEQLEQFQQMATRLAEQQATHLAALERLAAMDERSGKQLEVAQEQTALAEEVLGEAREQTGVLKRFETDLAVSIGHAVTSGFSPQMQEMTGRLEHAITELSDRMGTMNEEALRTMMENFSKAISDNTEEEMAQFKATLLQLSTKLDNSASALQSGINVAADDLRGASQGLTQDVAAAAQALSQSLGQMDQVIGKTTVAVREVDAAVGRAAGIGARGAERMDASMEAAARLIDQLGQASQTWTQVNTDIRSLMGALADAADGLDELAQEQSAAIRAVREVGPDLAGTAHQVRDHLEKAGQSMAQSMGQVQGAMGRTSGDLTQVVASIREGVVEYSKQLAALHGAMDTEMAKAIGKLGGAIASLDETITELTEGLEQIQKRE